MKSIPLIVILIFGVGILAHSQVKNSRELYDLNTQVESRSISFENPTGEPGSGGKASSNLGIGRKGSPSKLIKAHEEVTLCDIKHSGVIRHIWMGGSFTGTEFQKEPERNKLLRAIIIRAYWDGQEHPGIECPLGDFMGLAHSKVTSYQSAVHSIGEAGALNFWLPMPFRTNAKITLTNDSEIEFGLWYQVDYTVNDHVKKNAGRLHVCFQRQNPTRQKQDFEILPKRTGEGRFMGAVIGVRSLHPGWWGEGEVKIYKDGDTEYPAICGTGSEDYVGLSWGVQKTTFLYHGCNLNFKSDSTVQAKKLPGNEMVSCNPEYVSMYRWHIPDPVYWKKDCRITIQQIGWSDKGFYERDDDWSAAAFWYEPVPSAPLPPLPSVEERTKDLGEVFRTGLK